MRFHSILGVFFLDTCENKAVQKFARIRPARDPYQVKKHKKLVHKTGLLLVITCHNMVKKFSKELNYFYRPTRPCCFVSQITRSKPNHNMFLA